MTKQIPLTQGQVAIVCDCHAHLVEHHKWNAIWISRKRQFGAKRKASLKERLCGVHETIYMHAVINNTPKGFHTDHINNNSLDNRCCNLRTATTSENAHNRAKSSNNTSGYKGVRYHQRDKKWIAQIATNGKQLHIGMFNTADAAARAYDKKAKELHGEFANLNFPE